MESTVNDGDDNNKHVEDNRDEHNNDKNNNDDDDHDQDDDSNNKHDDDHEKHHNDRHNNDDDIYMIMMMIMEPLIITCIRTMLSCRCVGPVRCGQVTIHLRSSDRVFRVCDIQSRMPKHLHLDVSEE